MPATTVDMRDVQGMKVTVDDAGLILDFGVQKRTVNILSPLAATVPIYYSSGLGGLTAAGSPTTHVALKALFPSVDADEGFRIEGLVDKLELKCAAGESVVDLNVSIL